MDLLMTGASSWHCLKFSLLGVTMLLFAESKKARYIRMER